jgi:capsular polysaccharide biosynthesis protein
LAYLKAVQKTFRKYHQSYIIIASCLLFHAKYRWPGYSRSTFNDIRQMRRLIKNRLICQQSEPINSLLMQASDPASVWWRCTHDGVIASCAQIAEMIWADERGFIDRGAFFSACFGSYLKKTGDFASAEKFYQRLSRKPATKYEAFLGLADVRHLIARWNDELAPFESFGAYPSTELVGKKFSADWGETISSFTFNDAIEFYKKATQVSAEGLCARYHMARAFMDSGDVTRAARQFAVVHESRPDVIHAHLAWAYARAIELQEQSSQILRSATLLHPTLSNTRSDTKIANIIPTETMARESGAPTFELLPAQCLNGDYRVSYKGKISTRLIRMHFPPIAAASLTSARCLGHGLQMASDKYLLADGKTNAGAAIKIFAPTVLAKSQDIVLLGFPPKTRAVQTQRTIVLPTQPINYYHWIMEALAKLILLSDVVDLSQYTLVCQKAAQFQIDSLQAALSSIPAMQTEESRIDGLIFDHLLHIQNPSPHNIPNPGVVERIRRRLSRHFERPTKGKRVYLSRLNMVGRKTLNEQAVADFLLRHGFEIKDPAGLTLEEQIEFYKDVEILVAPGGAALTNLTFCPTDTRVIILTSAFHYFETFTAIAVAIGQRCWVCLSEARTHPNPYFIWSTYDMEVDLGDLAACLQDATDGIETPRRAVER